MALLMVGLLMPACTGGGGDKTDNTANAVKNEQMKDELVEALGTKREALDAFDQAVAALSQDVPDMGKAQELLEKALSISPDFLEAQFNLGVVYENNSRYDKALEAYGKAQKLDKTNTHAVSIIVAIGRTQSLKGDTEAAVKSFDEALRLEPENIDVLNGIGAVYFKAGKYDEAVDFVKKVLREDNENLTALNTLAQVYTARDNRSMAVYVFKKAARVAIGAITNDEELNIEPAILVIEDKLKKKDIDTELAADLFNNLGMIYQKMDELPLAVYNFSAAAKLSPTHVESRLNLGSIFLRYLNYEGAKAKFGEALQAAPGNCTAKLGLAASDFALSKHDDAIKGYGGYLENCNANDASANLQMQRIYEQRQDFDSAIKYCKKYVEVAKPAEGSPVTAEYCKALENMKNMVRDAPMDPAEGGEGMEGGEEGMEGGEGMEGDVIPAEGEEGDVIPAEGEEGDVIPAEGEEGAAPAEGGEAPAEGDAAPAEGGEAPAPAEGGDAPAPAEGAP